MTDHVPYSDPSEYDFDIADMHATTPKGVHTKARTGEGEVVDCCDGEKECNFCLEPFLPGENFLQCMGCLGCFHVGCVNGHFKGVINAHKQFSTAEAEFKATRNNQTESGQLKMRNVRKITTYLSECIDELRDKYRKAKALLYNHGVTRYVRTDPRDIPSNIHKLIDEIYMLQNEICFTLPEQLKKDILSDTWYGVRDFLPYRFTPRYFDRYKKLNDELWNHVQNAERFKREIHDTFHFFHTDPSFMSVRDLMAKSRLAVLHNTSFVLKHDEYKGRNLTTMETLRHFFVTSFSKQAKEERENYNMILNRHDAIMRQHNALLHSNTFRRARTCPKCKRDWRIHPPYCGVCPDKRWDHVQKPQKLYKITNCYLREEIEKLKKQTGKVAQLHVSRNPNEASSSSSRPAKQRKVEVDLVSRAGQISHTRYDDYPDYDYPDSDEDDSILDYEFDNKDEPVVIDE